MARQHKLSASAELQRVAEEAAKAASVVSVQESMYIGPTIPGTIHQNAIYLFGKEQLSASETELAAALSFYDEKGKTDNLTAYQALQMAAEKYPEIAELIVPVEEIMQGLKDINTRGTDLYRARRALVKATRR